MRVWTRSSCDTRVHGGGFLEKGLRCPDSGKAMPSGRAPGMEQLSGLSRTSKCCCLSGWRLPGPAEPQQRRHEGSRPRASSVVPVGPGGQAGVSCACGTLCPLCLLVGTETSEGLEWDQIFVIRLNNAFGLFLFIHFFLLFMSLCVCVGTLACVCMHTCVEEA